MKATKSVCEWERYSFYTTAHHCKLYTANSGAALTTQGGTHLNEYRSSNSLYKIFVQANSRSNNLKIAYSTFVRIFFATYSQDSCRTRMKRTRNVTVVTTVSTRLGKCSFFQIFSFYKPKIQKSPKFSVFLIFTNLI